MIIVSSSSKEIADGTLETTVFRERRDSILVHMFLILFQFE